MVDAYPDEAPAPESCHRHHESSPLPTPAVKIKLPRTFPQKALGKRFYAHQKKIMYKRLQTCHAYTYALFVISIQSPPAIPANQVLALAALGVALALTPLALRLALALVQHWSWHRHCKLLSQWHEHRHRFLIG
jgi:hypothetical protein